MSAAAIRRRTNTRRSTSTQLNTRSCGRSSRVKTGAGVSWMRWNLISPDWPALSFPEWESTCDTLHMWTQIVGKTRLALTRLENHWWNVTLYVTPRGLTTSPIPFGRRSFEVEFDLIAHQLLIRTSEGAERIISLFPRSVADFYDEYMACLRSLGNEVTLYRTPVEFDDSTPFDRDFHHASYDARRVE